MFAVAVQCFSAEYVHTLHLRVPRLFVKKKFPIRGTFWLFMLESLEKASAAGFFNYTWICPFSCKYHSLTRDHNP